RVMQFTGGRDAGSLSGDVEITLLSDFEKQTENKVRVINHDKLKDMDKEDILKRARDEYCRAKPEQVYDPANNNFQHLASRVAVGKNCSLQVEDIEQQMETVISNYVAKFIKDKKVTSIETVNNFISNTAGWGSGFLAKKGVKGLVGLVSRKVQRLSESEPASLELDKKRDDDSQSIYRSVAIDRTYTEDAMAAAA
ncbi:hypothetical protein N9V90_02170, partial [Endozoicomonas sp.]|nr:hypothetical protein [Endozoicomonas sp.]